MDKASSRMTRNMSDEDFHNYCISEADSQINAIKELTEEIKERCAQIDELFVARESIQKVLGNRDDTMSPARLVLNEIKDLLLANEFSRRRIKCRHETLTALTTRS